jgi:uncharacterized protein (DUF1697 family)
MPVFVVLLRGVNVGKAKRVPMAELKALLLGLGCTRATTLLNSGNAVVEHGRATAPALARRVADALAGRFGFEVPAIVKSSAKFEAIVNGNVLEFTEADHARIMVAFAQDDESLQSLRPLADCVVAPERLLLGEHAAYLHCANGILDSKVATALLGKVGKAVTTRNWATVLKLHTLACQRAG